MSIVDAIIVRCDRCGCRVQVQENPDADRSRSGYPEPRWPDGWCIVRIIGRNAINRNRDADVCPSCVGKIMDRRDD